MGLLDLDRRVFALGLAWMADAIGNSFPIVVLPLYIASGRIPIDALVGTRLAAFGIGVAIGPLASGYLERFGFAVPFLVAGALATLALVVVSTQVAETGDPDTAVGLPLASD